MRKPLPSIAELRSALDYNPETGALTWKVGQDAGGPAFATRSHGYLHGSFRGKFIGAHRVAWAMGYGCWPKHNIDHINGDKADNRLENLRDVPQGLNRRNAAKNTRNSSGVNGVHHDRRRGKWVARINVARKSIWLGEFDNLEDARRARQAANEQYGFTERHGRAA